MIRHRKVRTSFDEKKPKVCQIQDGTFIVKYLGTVAASLQLVTIPDNHYVSTLAVVFESSLTM